MERYKNLNGDSGIYAFEIGADYIVVEFQSGRTYLYTYRATGADNIERMKTLAIGGKGLGTYINRYVRKKFAKRLR